MRFLLTVAYKGTNFCGWQKQDNGRSVQEVLSDAIFDVLGERAVLHASGRTDAGVHAEGQRVHFDSDTKIPANKIPFALNVVLPQDVKVKDCIVVPEDFNARFSVKNKTYVYRFYCGPHENPLLFDTYAHLRVFPDLKKMRAVADVIEGEHDFKCFQASGGHVKSTVRTVYKIKINQRDEAFEIAVTGNGFLYNMVRIIAGTLYYAGINKLTVDDVKKAFKTSNRRLLGKTLEAKGLYLKEVVY